MDQRNLRIWTLFTQCTFFDTFLSRAICRCEKAAAAKGFRYFSIRYFGECHGLKSLPSEKSEFCVHHTFEQCVQLHERCVGAEEAEYVYKVKVVSQGKFNLLVT